MHHAATSDEPQDHTRSLVSAWALLVALTLASWWFRDHGLIPAAATTVILVITFIKVFIVGHSFMEIRSAPRALKTVFAVWCAGTCGTLVALALMA